MVPRLGFLFIIIPSPNPRPHPHAPSGPPSAKAPKWQCAGWAPAQRSPLRSPRRRWPGSSQIAGRFSIARLFGKIWGVRNDSEFGRILQYQTNIYIYTYSILQIYVNMLCRLGCSTVNPLFVWTCFEELLRRCTV